jgi:GntR family transcriptional regulator, transcriptional repressor for pyruvate dehydrogenase complex
MNDLFEIKQTRKSAVDIVVDKIKELLIQKKLKPGDSIPNETVLAESLKVSRGSIREAMKVLSALGVVDVRRGAGTFISTADNQKIFDPLLFKILVSSPGYGALVEVRKLMEKGIVDLIIQNASGEDLMCLDDIQKEFDTVEHDSSIDKAKGDRLDIEYHRTMGLITHNPIVANMYEFIIDLFAPTINSTIGYQAHRDMHEAIMNRDLRTALEMVEKHTDVWVHAHE